MNKSKLFIVVTVLMLLIVSAALAAGRPFATSLTGAAEAPNPGDPDGSGTALLAVNPGVGEICFTLTVSDIAPATASHIHEGAAGVSGGVVVPLTPPTSGCVSVDRTLALDIVRHPENYYVNVHNAEYPAGALRGQLSVSSVQ